MCREWRSFWRCASHTCKDQDRSEVGNTRAWVKQKEKIAAGLPEEEIRANSNPKFLTRFNSKLWWIRCPSPSGNQQRTFLKNKDWSPLRIEILILVNHEKAKAGQTYSVNVSVDKGRLQLKGWHKRGKSFSYSSFEPSSVTCTKSTACWLCYCPVEVKKTLVVCLCTDVV